MLRCICEALPSILDLIKQVPKRHLYLGARFRELIEVILKEQTHQHLFLIF